MRKSKRLNPADIRQRLAAVERWVEVPALGGQIRVVPPTFDRLIEIRDKIGGDDGIASKLAMLLAYCPDLADSVDELKKYDGVKLAQVLDAIVGGGLTESALGE